MKKLIILQAMFALTASFTINAMGLSYYMGSKQKDTSYNEFMAAKSQNLKKLLKKQLDPDIHINLNQLKLKRIEDSLREEEKEQINLVLHDSGLNQEQIKQIFSILQTICETRKKHLSQTQHMSAIHDPELSDYTKIIDKQLAEKKFNRNNINIIKDKPIFKTSVIENSQHIEHKYTITHNGTIKNYSANLYPDILLFNLEDIYNENIQKYILEAIENSIEGHSTILNTIISITNDLNWLSDPRDFTDFNYKSTTTFDVTTLPSYNKLIDIQNKKIKILPSLRNSESALILRSYYPNDSQLNKIDETHKNIAHWEDIKKTKLLQ